ncbi:DNA polymerase IV [Thalassotalea hakodatensis]|uniref:DNA polymerase IV n=1 Tax=Thalassotalea hakodatensis TaxID=3030492 RepID=UPI00257285B1|nr:DNA polymerase IV [Thalassotalea hakodatensis]
MTNVIMPNAKRKIIHIDMDAFYVSVEIRDNPELQGKPVAVGGPGNTRGVLSTCNYIARKYGVRSAMANSVALRKCPELLIVPGRMSVYKETSSRLHEIFQRYTSKIEPLSLDEAYLDVTDCPLFSGSATLIAQDIRKVIFDELQLTASAGIAPLKFLAKIASDQHKPNGQCVIAPDSVMAFIESMPLNKIPGVGKVTFNKLQQHGLHTGADVRQSSQTVLMKTFGKLGASLWQKCHGIDNRAVEVTRVRKSVGVEHTFSKDKNELDELTDYMLQSLIPELLTRSKSYTVERGISKLGVKVKFNDFHQTTKEIQHQDIDSASFILLLKEALSRGEGKPVRLLGVHIGLKDIEPKVNQQYQFELALPTN